MKFTEQCIQDSMPIWEKCLNSPFLTRLEKGTLDENCFKGYIVDDSLYLWNYAKVFAWGLIRAEDIDALRTFYSFLAFVNEGEGSTRVEYLHRWNLADEEIQHLPQRPENKAYTDYMMQSAQEGVAECMMAALPCTLSYGWIFTELLKRSPEVRNTLYWPLVKDYTEAGYDEICRKWIAFGDQVCEGLPQERLKHCMDIFRECSKLELGFWKMSETPRKDL